jgi:Zn-dependent M28 family amino/carboxypeptidase
VIGVLNGEGALVDEWIVVGAHYDHIGCRREPGGPLVYNGADDNASGTAVILELARVLAARLPEAATNRRSIMFIAFGSEELGLWGSRDFVLSPPIPLDDIVAMINLDMVGRLRQSVTVFGVGMADGWEELLDGSNEVGLNLALNYGPTNGSDHVPFLQHSIPSVFLHTGLHDQYHAPGDDPGLINYAGMVTIAEFTAELVTRLTVTGTPPDWAGP